MVARFFMKSRTIMRLLAGVAVCSCLTNGVAWAGNQLPLSLITVPEPANLFQFVKSKAEAIKLGKALFWDMQVGSDGIQACASCHYRAGADPVNIRARNQLHPGPDVIFGNNSTVIRTFTTDPLTGLTAPLTLEASGFPLFRPNYTLQTFDFPLFRVFPVTSRLVIDPVTGLTSDEVTLLRDTNDVVGSQGVRLAQFAGIDPNSDQDLSTPLTDQLFRLNGVNIRQVTGRNTPAAINAVFNYANFWDGRANNIFNGVNPLGPLDVNARIWVNNNGTLEQQQIAIRNASLASQATGPPLSDVEMSFRGRTFPELGRKMLNPGLVPLGKQLVHPNDSVLGPSANPGKGLNANYAQMVRDAFQDIYWNSTSTTPDGFSQMEANFSLFWGLAIQLYEATLVSDQTPFDRFQSGNQNAMSPVAQRGLATFDSKCAVCHSGTEFTTAATGSSIGQCTAPDCNRLVFTNNTSHTLIKQEVNPITFAIGLTDTGFSNIGVRPTAENAGRGAGEPDFPFPLSFTRLAKLAALGGLPFVTPRLPAGVALATPDIVNGSFKTPGLRNVELTPPYFHNGDALSLDQVVEFYTRGGDFPGNRELAAAMQPIGKLRGDAAGRLEVVEFLKALTDERVRNEWAPFDHPELQIPHGVDELSGAELMITLPATGGAPDPVPPATLTLNPVTTPTLLTSQLLSGTVDSAATVTVSVNNGTPVFATVPCIIDPLTLQCTTNAPVTSNWSATVTGMVVGHNSITVTATSTTGGTQSVVADIQVMPSATISGIPLGGRTTLTGATLTIGGAGVVSYRFSFDGSAFSADIPVATPIVLSGLADGTHTIVVLGKDIAGNQQPETLPTTGIWSVKANPPVLTLDLLSSPTRGNSQTISGTVELGSVPTVRVDSGATAGPVRTIGGTGISTWSCDISGLVEGANNITVTAFDFVFNVTTISATIIVDITPPALALTTVSTPARLGTVQTVSGTVEEGLTPVIAVIAPAVVDQVTAGGGTWSAQLSGLAEGNNTITVSATDQAGNVTTSTAEVTIVVADGDFSGAGSANISDALKALRIAVSLDTPSATDMLHGDVAPLDANGVPAPDNRIDVADALVILRKVVGLIQF
ncbi:MAG: Ig-like domain-containing protein [Geobacteraceae bacterium]|nr:Ig-like domain-containing protein [Geobacteraceae bacterium]